MVMAFALVRNSKLWADQGGADGTKKKPLTVGTFI
jgi:hypothetical protein